MVFSRSPLGLTAKPRFYLYLNTGTFARSNGKVSNRKKKPKLDWIGDLKEYRNQYTALELQKQTLDWRD